MKKKSHLSVGQVAEICGVSDRTVKVWMDKGELDAFYVGPTSTFRRTTKDALRKFMRKHGMPMDGELQTRVLLVGLSPQLARDVEGSLGAEFRVFASDDLFDAGRLFGEFLPKIVVLDFSLGRSDCLITMANIDNSGLPVEVLALTSKNEKDGDLKRFGFRRCIQRPFDVKDLIAEIEGANHAQIGDDPTTNGKPEKSD